MKKSFKSILSLFLAVAMTFGGFSANITAEEIEPPALTEITEEIIPPAVMASAGVLTYTVSGIKATITDCLETATDEQLAAAFAEIEAAGYTITSIAGYAFIGCNSLESIDFPEGLQSIGECAFQFCALKEIILPTTLTSIGGYAFQNCDFESVIIPNGVTRIEAGTFCDCYNLKSVTLPDNMTALGEYAFQSVKVTTFTVPDGVTEIGATAFSKCLGLKEITIPGSVTAIDSNAFASCTNLTVYAPIGSYAESFANENGITFKDSSVVVEKDFSVNVHAGYVPKDTVVTLKKGAQTAFYTTDMTDPTVSATKLELTSDIPITITDTTIIKVANFRDGYYSGIETFTYLVKKESDKILTGVGLAVNVGDEPFGMAIPEATVKTRVETISQFSDRIRTFSTLFGNQYVPKYAENVMVGVYITDDAAQNNEQISGLIAMLQTDYAENIEMIAVGNETALLGVSDEILSECIMRVRQAVIESGYVIPIGTVQTYGTSLSGKINSLIDFLGMNIYSGIWDSVPAESAPAALETSWADASNSDKFVLLTETGMPYSSVGETSYNLPDGFSKPAPTVENAQNYFKHFLEWTNEQNIPAYYFQAFEQSYEVKNSHIIEPYFHIIDKDMEMLDIYSSVAETYADENGMTFPTGEDTEPTEPVIEFSANGQEIEMTPLNILNLHYYAVTVPYNTSEISFNIVSFGNNTLVDEPMRGYDFVYNLDNAEEQSINYAHSSNADIGYYNDTDSFIEGQSYKVPLDIGLNSISFEFDTFNGVYEYIITRSNQSVGESADTSIAAPEFYWAESVDDYNWQFIRNDSPMYNIPDGAGAIQFRVRPTGSGSYIKSINLNNTNLYTATNGSNSHIGIITGKAVLEETENTLSVTIKAPSGAAEVHTYTFIRGSATGEIVYGDANGDGVVGNMDVTLLKQSLAGWKVTIFDGADANGDNTLSNMDVTLIKQHLAGWKVTLGKTNSSGDNKNDELDDGDNNDDDDDLDIGGGDIIDDGDDGDDEIDDGDDEIDTGDDDLPDNSFDDYAEEMLVMINAARTEAGLSPLQLSTELCRAANIRSVELVTSFSHTRPNGENPSSVLAEINYPGSSGCAENIAAGQNSVSAAFTGWMNSQGHYENIMDPDNKFIGIGYYYYADSQYKHHWTQLFTSVDSAVTDDYADEILTKINAERAIVGAPALQLNEKLAEAALIRAEELSIDNSFTRPNGTLWYTVLQELNYPAASYNSSIYAGPASADDAFNGWLTSSYAVLTDPDFKYFGVGYYRADTGQKHYWSYFITT